MNTVAFFEFESGIVDWRVIAAEQVPFVQEMGFRIRMVEVQRMHLDTADVLARALDLLDMASLSPHLQHLRRAVIRDAQPILKAAQAVIAKPDHTQPILRRTA